MTNSGLRDDVLSSGEGKCDELKWSVTNSGLMRCQESGVRCQVSGVRCQKSGVR